MPPLFHSAPHEGRADHERHQRQQRRQRGDHRAELLPEVERGWQEPLGLMSD
jgi:hypothetical protein